MRPRIATTLDGSHTLVDPVTGSAYHSMNGAMAESRHVFVDNGFGACRGERVRVLEMGFGSGLNAWLTLLAGVERGVEVEYTAVEARPVDEATAGVLNYTADPLFMELHRAPWGCVSEICGGFTLMKIEADIRGVDLPAEYYDVVYFDAFAPDVQPELWSVEVFGAIYGAMAPGGVLVTYSAAGAVKRALREAGFAVQRLAGAPGKRHMVRAVKNDK